MSDDATRDPVLVLSDELCDLLFEHQPLIAVAALTLSLNAMLFSLSQTATGPEPAYLAEIRVLLQRLLSDTLYTRDFIAGVRREPLH